MPFRCEIPSSLGLTQFANPIEGVIPMKTLFQILTLALLALLAGACNDPGSDDKQCSFDCSNRDEPTNEGGCSGMAGTAGSTGAAENPSEAGNGGEAGSPSEAGNGGEAGSGIPDAPPPPPFGRTCLSIIDQQGQPMGCVYRYNFPSGVTGLEGSDHCSEGQLLIEGSPGTYRVNAECNKLIGYAEVPVEAAEDTDCTDDTDTPCNVTPHLSEKRLVGSLCYDEEVEIILDPQYPSDDLGRRLGYSTDTRCLEWWSSTGEERGIYQIRDSEIDRVELDCGTATGPCEASEGRQYVDYADYGIHTGGWPMHLTVVDQGLVPASGEVRLLVYIHERVAPYQEITLPVIIRGPEE